jgi:UDP-N-acetylglucosamine 2-epimerase (non-hydrolysing)
MSDVFFADLDLPAPDVHLHVGSGSHAYQTARALEGVAEVLERNAPDLLVVGGDVNSTLAAALAAVKLNVPIAHVESGLRSFDWSMPEEINRVLTDRLSDLLFTHSPEAGPNLAAEGIAIDRVHLVGNTMIDTLRRFEAVAEERRIWEQLGLLESDYVLVTLHRPSNVDAPDNLEAIVRALADLARRARVLFPIHPRTRLRLHETGHLDHLVDAGVACTEPLGYIDFLSAQLGAGAIVTDSGGIQEEAAALGVPCFTLRANTERPVTLELGTNTLLGEDPAGIAGVELTGGPRTPSDIPLWDGRAGERTAAVILSALGLRATEQTRIPA